MRSPAEIAFRLRQELANLLLYLRPPHAPTSLQPLPLPPLPPVAAALPTIAPPVPWRQDPTSKIETPLVYFRRIPYLDPARAGDHKAIWDRNRCQELAVLSSQGQHALVQALLADWIAANPVHRGMNWTSALEVAFRALSWLYIWHTPGATIPPSFLNVLYAHGAHLFHNLSVYFSPNTHLLGEAVVLHALGLFFRQPHWEKRGRANTLACLESQVFPDGAYFEQSTYYHVYALDFFLLHHALVPLPAHLAPILTRMGLFLQSLLGQAGEIPFLGDDDGGRLYHPFAPHASFGLHTLAQLPPLPPAPLAFPSTGLYFLANDRHQILCDAGPFARGSAGHSHADTLQVLARIGPEEVLIDPGTFTYVADTQLRDLFRGPSMHNTIACDSFPQALPAGPFRWLHPPQVRVLASSPNFLEAESLTAGGFVHRRKLQWNPATFQLHIEDSLDGPPGQHPISQFWHFASPPAASRLHCQPCPGFSLNERPDLSFRSRRFGHREPAPALAFSGTTSFPANLSTRLDLTPSATIPS
ncbi:MAG: alginate lyase family protein [Bryobacter sp.]|nr:alginate lyase family protein [Bryobacter sp.]